MVHAIKLFKKLFYDGKRSAIKKLGWATDGGGSDINSL